MIKAEELRIGNYVYSGIYSNKVIEVYPMFFVQLSKIEDKEHNIKPIPLTEEWLIKFGFEYKNPFGYKIKNGCYVKDDLETNGHYFRWNGQTLSLIHYVHQLQNLYFALTNKELTYDKEIQAI